MADALKLQVDLANRHIHSLHLLAFELLQSLLPLQVVDSSESDGGGLVKLVRGLRVFGRGEGVDVKDDFVRETADLHLDGDGRNEEIPLVNPRGLNCVVSNMLDGWDHSLA